jgi:hypothetical protein
VLQLLDHYSIECVERGIRICQARGQADAVAVITAIERSVSDTGVSLDALLAPVNISVPLPDLSQFDRLLSHSWKGVDDHERCQRVVTEGQPEAIALADDAG